MFSGIKLIPREKLLEDDSLSTDNRRKIRKEKHHHSSSDEDDDLKGDERHAWKSKKKRRSGTWNCSDSDSSSSKRENKSYSDKGDKRSKSGKKRNDKDSRKKRHKESSYLNGKKGSDDNNRILRKEMGLDWMLRPGNSLCNDPASVVNEQESEVVEEGKKMNPKELNPYLQDNGSGYPNDASNATIPNQLLSSSLVGDGGASWRLKALKRAKEQAAREGRTLQEVVGDRWDSLQELATSVAGHRSAPSHAHLHAIKERKRGHANLAENQDKMINNSDYIKDVPSGNSEMKKPKHDNLQWRSKNFKRIPLEDSLVSEAISSINKFCNDGSFMDSINLQKKDADVHLNSFPNKEAKAFCDNDLGLESRDCDEMLSAKRPALSSNQLAAKVLQLKMKGKHEEAENLSKRMDLLEEDSKKATRQEGHCSSSRKLSKTSDGDDDKIKFTRQILTQKERCQFCFENPSRQKHLVVSIGNTTYMMLPPWEPVIQGHCCILPLQHELSTRTIDQSVWEEIRNYKKCLLKMFSRQDKDVIFLETAIELSRQRRHCLIECIPLPSSIAKQAPLYFKKAIDEAEGEWGQHDNKKVIPTSGNLRNVIPENFSYFHVEFGLDRGFVHVIDDDNNFPSSFGVNVVRGMLRLPEETMRRHHRRGAAEDQKRAVAAFVQEWEPFDWTRELD